MNEPLNSALMAATAESLDEDIQKELTEGLVTPPFEDGIRNDSLIGRSKISLQKNHGQLSERIDKLHKQIQAAARDRDDALALIAEEFNKTCAAIERELWQAKTVRAALELALASLPEE